ncbi:sensor histidine kinase [Psychroflexus aestuariivivens]|uniref:sensor histidine kinase n=1 Tax=Psychroflexus aestuariivivens TaxID=1795040 RepID=UPI000FDC4FBF|nr:histidine kinase [Psychroflexus aestuariivivens]
MKSTFLQQIIRFIIISIVIAVFIRLINFAGSNFQVEELFDGKSFLINFMYAFIIGISNITFFEIILKKYSWQKDAKTLLWLGIAGSVVLSTLAFFVARLLHIVIILDYSFAEFLEMETVLNYVVAVFIALIVTLAFHAFYFYKALKDTELSTQQNLTETAKAKHEALKNQLDPHFLFNSLNVLSSLIEENQSRAVQFTNALSKIYRYVLDQRQADLVEVSSEIEFAKTYIDLLKMRFEDSITCSINIDHQDLKIVPLSLQLLLENAIKHNKISELKPLHIKIYNENNKFLIVENNLNLKRNIKQSTGIGLDNIKFRYEAVVDRTIEIEKTESHFRVKLPLIKA